MEQNCVLWHSSLTQENAEDLERYQRSAVRVILGSTKYKNYREGLQMCNLELLAIRRTKITLKLAKQAIKHDKIKFLFPLNNENGVTTRNKEKFQVLKCNTDRLKNSTIVYLQKLVNEDQQINDK